MTGVEMGRFGEIIGRVDPTRLVFVLLSDNIDCERDCGLYNRCSLVEECREAARRGELDDPINTCTDIIEHYIRFGDILDLRKECDKYV